MIIIHYYKLHSLSPYLSDFLILVSIPLTASSSLTTYELGTPDCFYPGS